MGRLDDIIKGNPLFFSMIRGGLLGLSGAAVAWDRIVKGDPIAIGGCMIAFIGGALRAGDRNPV